MSIPTWALLGFAAWTLLLLVSTVGVYRWLRILTGRVAIRDFPADAAGGEDWYQRATRAHANCVENLPVFGAIVLALHVSRTAGPLVDALALAVPAARVCQSLVHVCCKPSNAAASWRFAFFFAQFLCFAGLIALLVARHGW